MKNYNMAKITAIIIFMLNFIYINYINFVYLDKFMTSDLVNEIQYIKFIVESKQWLPENFIPSAELFLNRPSYLSAVIYFFIKDVVLSYQITFLIMQVIFAFILYKVLKSINIKSEYIYIYMALFWSFGNFGFLGALLVGINAYIFIFICGMLFIYVFINFELINKKKIYIYISFFISFYLGCSGPKFFVFFIFPLGVYLLLKYIMNKKKDIRNEIIFKWLIFSIIGILINKIILLKWVYCQDISVKYNDLINLIYLFMQNIGVIYNSIISSKYILLEITHYIEFVGFMISLYNFNKIFEKKQKELFSILGISTLIIIVGNLATNNNGLGAERYLINCLLWILLGFIILCQNYTEYYKRKLIFIFLLIICIVQLLVNIFQINISKNFTMISLDHGKGFYNYQEKDIASYLKENDYKRIYASYWNSSILLYYLDFNDFVVGHWGPGIDENLEPFFWLVNKEAFENFKGKVALLLTDEELEKLSNIGKYRMKEAVFRKKIGDMNIYECDYNPIKPLIKMPENKNDVEIINLDNPKISIVGKIEDNKLVSDEQTKGFILFGPYINDNNFRYGDFIPKENIYDIELDYKILNDNKNKVFFDVAFDGGKVIERQELDKNSEVCILKEIDLSGKKNIEFRVFKEDGISMEVRKIKITKK